MWQQLENLIDIDRNWSAHNDLLKSEYK